jgi:prepilin-type N-terminal cleavage/methylation domain-containing protein
MTTLRRERHRDDSGMTLVEVMVTSTILVVLLGMVFISITMVEGLSSSVTSQYQEFNQALPEMAPFHSLLAAEVEPAPAVSGVPTPGFSLLGNFALTFYANIGTAYDNTAACPSGQSCATGGTTAGPAMIEALELGPNGSPVSSPQAGPGTACNTVTPCSFQVRLYLPEVGLTAPGVSSCPGVGTGPTCQYGTSYRLLANVANVVNDPSALNPDGSPADPIFGYTVFDGGGTYGATTYPDQAITLTSGMVQTGSVTGLVAKGYPVDGQSLATCGAPSVSYPTAAVACPADAVQSVSIDLQIAQRGTGTNGSEESNLVVYRYAQSPGSSTAPYQYTAAVG